jgi:hypothetical protein
MTRLKILYQVILALHSWQDRAEPWDEWELRADTIAEAIDVVARTNEEAAFLTYMAWHEGRNSLDVHRGKLTVNRHGKYWGLWQVKMKVGDVYSWAIPTVVITKYMAELAIDTLHTHRGHGTLTDGIRGYGGYKRWSPTPRILAARIRKIERKLDEMTGDVGE